MTERHSVNSQLVFISMHGDIERVLANGEGVLERNAKSTLV